MFVKSTMLKAQYDTLTMRSIWNKTAINVNIRSNQLVNYQSFCNAEMRGRWEGSKSLEIKATKKTEPKNKHPHWKAISISNILYRI